MIGLKMSHCQKHVSTAHGSEVHIVWRNFFFAHYVKIWKQDVVLRTSVIAKQASPVTFPNAFNGHLISSPP